MPAPYDGAVEAIRTEFAFTLPVGYLDDEGVPHREGRMRLATARDEIMPLRDPRVQANEAYLTVILLSRVITELGTLTTINPAVVEGMFAADLAFLQDLYRRINAEGHTRVAVSCPECSHHFAADLSGAGSRKGGS
ncbi:hypothetical protein AB0K51_01260 [Kitasatospora sp. NPDC049285]|uniref:hypothetical protein n=1 Tax=Kitasatospora sp. NPDC049285 TaxID=3157096 RepID=UPI0034478569